MTRTGARSRRKVSGRTQREARERLEALKRAIAVGPGLPAEVTVGAFLEHWLDHVLPLSRVASTTADNYRRIVDLYLKPHLGRVRLDKLTPAHVRTMLTKLREYGLSPNTARLARSVLRRALRTAEADQLVTRNVAALVDGVRLDHVEGRTLTPEQARAFLATIYADEYGPALATMLTLGLRKGEALGLTWEDVRLDAGTITVRRALKKDGRGATFLDSPKTRGSHRTIHAPAPLVEILRRHHAAQAAARLTFGPGWGGGWPALVFTTPLGTPLDPDRVNRRCQALAVKAGLGPWTPHELRHSAASLLLAQGVSLKVVSETLGHSSIRVTADVYGHLMEPARAEAATAIGAALWPEAR